MSDNHNEEESVVIDIHSELDREAGETLYKEEDKDANLLPDENRKRPNLASHHRKHHHHHHTHTSGLRNTEGNENIDNKEISRIEDTVSDATPGIASRKRIPLAAHHRSHRHHRSESYKEKLSSRRRHHSIRRQSYEELNKSHTKPAAQQFSGQMTAVEIDMNEFERLENESINEMRDERVIKEAENGNYGSADSIPDTGNIHNEKTDRLVDRENISDSKSASGFTSDRSEEAENNVQKNAPRLASTILAAREIKPRATRSASSVKSSGSRQRRAQSARRTTVFTIATRILLCLVVLLFSGIGVLLYMRTQGASALMPNGDTVEIVMPEEEIPEEVESVEDGGKTIIYKGEKYRWNDNLFTVLFLGTDRTVAQQESGVTMAGKNGQADTMLLGVIDNTNKRISFININRDTFTSVAEYAPDGDYAGEKKMQICLSYAYGKDNKTSCKYTAEAVSKYLYGMPVDSYVSISYDAIPMLNDSVGGVTLSVIEDMTRVDASLTEGATVTLVGSQALTYCRWRDHSVINTNENRMSRQKQYLRAFMKRTIEATRSDLTLPIGLYQNVKPYMTTNISASGVTYMTSKVLEYGISDDAIHGIPGESVLGANDHVEFYPDQKALYEMVLETFYNKVES